MADKSCASPQLENGHFHIANELFEAMIKDLPFRLPGPVAIFLAVMRETYGFGGRKTAEITTERFKKLTGISHRNNIYRAIKLAVESGLINAIKNDGKRHATYSINKRYKGWKCAIKNDGAIISDSKSNQKRLHQQSKMMAVCMLKKPFKETIKETPLSHIPEDFTLTPGLKAYAVKKGIPDNQVQNWFDAFINKSKANDDKKANWASAWFAYISAVAANPKNNFAMRAKAPTWDDYEQRKP